MMKYTTNDPNYIIIKNTQIMHFIAINSKIQFLEIHYSKYSMNICHKNNDNSNINLVSESNPEVSTDVLIWYKHNSSGYQIYDSNLPSKKIYKPAK